MFLKSTIILSTIKEPGWMTISAFNDGAQVFDCISFEDEGDVLIDAEKYDKEYGL